MKPQSSSIVPFTLVFLLSFHGIALTGANENFLQCLSLNSEKDSISEVIYTKNNSSYSSLLNFSIQNLLFSTPACPKPQYIITPFHIYQIQVVVKCAEKQDLQIKVRSGGHDSEGLSYCSDVPFVMIDLINFSSIQIDAEEKTAWVQAGATLGELYYRANKKNKNLGFPAGMCTTVGLGGHFSGGGYGFMLRKFGLAADNVVDAHLIDVKGRILDRKSMGEDLFWAIRGGGGANFGVIVAWKVKLVTVPTTVTVFTVKRTLEQNVLNILHKYQHIVDKLPEDIIITTAFGVVNSSMEGQRTIAGAFSSLFLGGVDRLLPLMQEWFPELGLTKEDCMEMSWLESVVYLNSGFERRELYNVEELLDRNYSKNYSKLRSDYAREPIPMKAFERIFDLLYEKGGDKVEVVFFPYGGKMSEISESAIPFPHRAGNIYHLMYFAEWENEEESRRVINLVNKMYNYMTPYVSKNPRATYLNCRDLGIGRNNKGDAYTSIEQASIWGKKYYKNNFYRLVDVKTKVDPENFFRFEQSIPPRSSWHKEVKSLDVM